MELDFKVCGCHGFIKKVFRKFENRLKLFITAKFNLLFIFIKKITI